MYYGYFGLFVLVADIFAIVNIVKSTAPTDKKFLWCLLIVLLPVFGLIIWFVADGPRNR
jgi:hypothetical protein